MYFFVKNLSLSLKILAVGMAIFRNKLHTWFSIPAHSGSSLFCC
jgi:hypothetical protein